MTSATPNVEKPMFSDFRVRKLRERGRECDEPPRKRLYVCEYVCD